MGWINRIFRPGKHDAEVALDTVKTLNDNLGSTGGLVGGTTGLSASPAFNRTEIISMYRKSPRFRSVVNKIAEKCASIDWTLGFVQNEKAFKAGLKYSGAIQSGHIKRIHNMRRRKQAISDARFVTIEDHPILRLMSNGNGDELDGFAVRKLHRIYMDIAGESFLMKVHNSAGVPVQLWPIPPNWVVETPSSGKDYFRLRKGNIKVEPSKIIWFKDADPGNPYGRGSGMGESLGDELDSDEYAAKLIKAAFINKGLPSGIASIKGAKGDSVKALQQNWENEHRGFQSYGRVKFTNAEIDFKKVNNTFEELQLNELRKDVRDVVQQVYGLPPEIAGILENSNRATIEDASYIMAEFVLIPRLEQERRMYDRTIVRPIDDRLVLDYEDPTPESTVMQLDAAKAAPYHITKNEYRTKFLGLDAIGPAGDAFYTPINLIRESVASQEPAVLQEQPELEVVEPLALPEASEEEKVPACCEEALQKPHTKFYSMLKSRQVKQVDNIVNAVDPARLTGRLEPIWGEELREWGDNVLDELDLGVAFNMQNPAITSHLMDWKDNRIKGLVNENTKELLRESMAEGIAAGEGADALAKRVRGIFIDDKTRAVRIARTETIRSANFGSLEAYTQSGVIEGKQWIAALANTRPEHEELHGTIVAIGDEFEVDGYTTMHPAGFGVAGLDINCMCVIVGVVNLEEAAAVAYNSAEHQAIVKQFQAGTYQWEQLATSALEDGFKEQAEDVIAVIESEL